MQLNRRSLWFLIFLIVAGCQSGGPEEIVSGEEVYNTACAGCHETPDLTRAPARALLEGLGADAILANLETGTMVSQGILITRQQRIAVAEYLGAGKVSESDENIFLPTSGFCSDSAAPVGLSGRESGWNGWGGDLENTRFRTAAASGLSAEVLGGLKLKWAFAFPRSSMAASHPAYMDGRIFVGSITGVVYSLDAESGCIHWIHQATAGVRGGVAIGRIGQGDESRAVVFFGDTLAQLTALDADSGELLWRVDLDGHSKARITATPQFHQGRVYVPVASLEEVAAMNPNYECCTFRGSVAALDAASGEVIWQRYLIAQEPVVTGDNAIGTRSFGPSGASVWSAPTIDTTGGMLYIGTGDNYSSPGTLTSDAIVALDLETGEMKWARQMLANDVYNTSCDVTPDELNCPAERGPDYDFASPPILRTLASGKRVLVAGQKSGVVHALDPDRQGEILWQTRVSNGGVIGGIQWGMGADRDTVYVPISDLDLGGDAMLGGGLHALRLDTGEFLWSAEAPAPTCIGIPWCSKAQSEAVTVIPGVVFSGSQDGHIRAYSAVDGAILWEFNTARDYETVNGEPGFGGSLNGSGAAVAAGMLFVNSGYYIGLPGNVLLAFSLQ